MKPITQIAIGALALLLVGVGVQTIRLQRVQTKLADVEGVSQARYNALQFCEGERGRMETELEGVTTNFAADLDRMEEAANARQADQNRRAVAASRAITDRIERLIAANRAALETDLADPTAEGAIAYLRERGPATAGGL